METLPASLQSEYMQPGSYRGPCYMGSPSVRLWHQLQAFLERFEGGSGVGRHGLLCVAAAEALLQENPALQLPWWLLAMLGTPASVGQPQAQVNTAQLAGSFAGGSADPAALLRIYLKHDRLEDAAQLLAEHLKAWVTLSPLQRQKVSGFWIPTRSVQQLVQAVVDAAQAARKAGDARTAERLEAALQHLEASAKHWLDVSVRDSDQAVRITHSMTA